MTEQEVRKIFEKYGAILANGHFVYTSGRHGSEYINKDAIYPHIKAIKTLCWQITLRVKHLNPDVVIAPAIGGVALSQWVAYQLTIELEREVLAVYAEKFWGKQFCIGRGYDKLIKNKRVLVVEDVLNSGGSAAEVVKLARLCGGEVVGVGALCNRNKVTVKDVGNVPELFALLNLDLESWEENECPLCKQGMPINTEVGKGKEYLARKKG